MSWIIHVLQGIKAEWIGGFAGGLILVICRALGPFLQRLKTRMFQRAAQEIDRMAEREKEVEQVAAEGPLHAKLIELGAELSAAKQRAERAEVARDAAIENARGLGDDMGALAAAKDQAEQDAEKWKKLALAAQAEADGLRNDMRGHQTVPVREKHAEVDPDPRGRSSPLGTHAGGADRRGPAGPTLRPRSGKKDG